jgi:hypothetical protein
MKKYLKKSIIKLALVCIGLLMFNISYGQGREPSVTNTANTIRAVTINSNNDNSPTSYQEFIYLRSGEDNGSRWFTDAQFIVADDWVGTRKPLRFYTANGSWLGSGDYIKNSKNGPSNDYGLGFFTNDAQRMVITEAGKVGINNNSPAAMLHVLENDGNNKGIVYENNGVKMKIGVTTAKTGGWFGTSSNHGLHIGTNYGGSLYLDVSNNVYVGQGASSIIVSDALKSKNDLFVRNGILAEDLTVGAKEFWADYVFNKEYKLRSLSELEQFIKKNKHLPNIPSKKVISKEGYSMHDMNVRFLEKMEELTLYIIKQEKQIKKLEKRLDGLSRSEK